VIVTAATSNPMTAVGAPIRLANSEVIGVRIIS